MTTSGRSAPQSGPSTGLHGEPSRDVPAQPLLLVPDVSMIGYLRGPRVGAILYNLAHDLATGAVIAAVGLGIGITPLIAIGAVFVAHSGMDRMMGYGLKLPSSFKDTHLGRIGRRN